MSNEEDYVCVPRVPTEAMIAASRQALGKYIRSLSREERDKVVGKRGGFRVFDETLKARIRYQAMIEAATRSKT